MSEHESHSIALLVDSGHAFPGGGVHDTNSIYPDSTDTDETGTDQAKKE